MTTKTRRCTGCSIPMVTRPKRGGTPPAGHSFHQARGLCNICYQRQLRQADTGRDITPRVLNDCTAITGTCDCHYCHLSAKDHESPLALVGGAWVPVRHGVRKWVPAA